MANEDIGTIDCAWCGSESPVRRRKDKKLYVMCPNCGQQFLNGPGGQDIILERATIWGVSAPAGPQKAPSTLKNDIPDTPVCEKNDIPAPPQANEPDPNKEKKSESLMDWFFGDDD